MLAPLVCLVVAISDGDTLKVRCGEPGQYEQITIRISAIDAPESKMPFGQRSKQALSDLCYQAQATVSPQAKDRYGRTVADVQCAGKDVGIEQVIAGMAWVDRKYAKRHNKLYPLQAAARAVHAGLWRDPAPQPPWEWRKQPK